MARSPGFGSTATNFRPIQTRFRYGSGFSALTLPATVTRRTVLQKVRRHTFRYQGTGMVLRPLVGIRFQVLFHSPPGVLFTFPSRYWFTIGRRVVFSLGRWSSQLPTGFHVPRGTQVSPSPFESFAYRTLTSCGGPFQAASARLSGGFVGNPTTPAAPKDNGFGLFPVRSPLLRESTPYGDVFLSLPAGT